MTEIVSNIRHEATGFTVTLDVDSRFTRAEIWHAISNLDALKLWLGKFSCELTTGARFSVDYPNDSDYNIQGTVHEVHEQRTLAYDWKFGEYRTCHIRFDLSDNTPTNGHVRLTISGLDKNDVVRAAATWHAQLELLRLYLNNMPVPAYALRFRRDELEASYEQQVRNLGTTPAAAESITPTTPAHANPVASVLHSHAYLA